MHDRNADGSFTWMLHQIYLIDRGCASLFFTWFIWLLMRLTAFGTTITATVLCGFACSAAIINNRNSCPDIYDCQGKYYSKYVTESLHIGCKDRNKRWNSNQNEDKRLCSSHEVNKNYMIIMKCFGISYLFICKKKWKYIKFKTEANG